MRERGSIRKIRRSFEPGDTTHELGLVLAGSVSIESDDLWGNKTVLDHIGSGCVFAETYACIQGEALMVNVITMEPTTILFLHIGKILEVCQKTWCVSYKVDPQSPIYCGAKKLESVPPQFPHSP